MSVLDRISHRFHGVEGGLFGCITKADVGDTMGDFLAGGGANMAWADPFAPNPSMPESVLKAMQEALATGLTSHYVQPIGPTELRETIAEKYSSRCGRPVHPTRNVLITPGSDSGLLYAMMPFVEDGDEVMVPDPSYPSNFLNCKLLGATAVPIPTYPEDNYRLHIEEFEKRLTPKTKVVLITNPNNPTTTVYSKEELEALSLFIIRNDLILVCDQAFEDHCFDGRECISPCSLPGMWERTVTVRSVSKGLGLSGLRIGYLIADDCVMDILYACAVNVLGAPNTLSCIGAKAAFEDDSILPAYYARLERRRDLAYSILSKIPGVQIYPSESGILTWMDVSKLGTGAEIAQYIRIHANIMVNDGAAYGEQGKGCIRIVSACFADDDEAASRFGDIRTALTKLAHEKGIE